MLDVKRTRNQQKAGEVIDDGVRCEGRARRKEDEGIARGGGIERIEDIVNLKQQELTRIANDKCKKRG